jgi:hypothetical protein
VTGGVVFCIAEEDADAGAVVVEHPHCDLLGEAALGLVVTLPSSLEGHEAAGNARAAASSWAHRMSSYLADVLASYILIPHALLHLSRPTRESPLAADGLIRPSMLGLHANRDGYRHAGVCHVN